MKNKPYIKACEVRINNQVHWLVEQEAYYELTLQMSTGDFHAHTVTKVLVPYDYEDLIYLDDLLCEEVYHD